MSLRIFEIVNKGKGVIENLAPENLLEIKSPSDGSVGKTPINIRNQYNGTSVTVPADFTLTRIISLNDPNTEFSGVVTGTDLEITDGVTNDIYLIDGYTI